MKTETQTTPKAQHTAGEWHTEECANGGLVVVLGERDQRVQIIDEKKAKLIAAAPELLEALKKITDINNYLDANQRFDIAHEAIKKATE